MKPHKYPTTERHTTPNFLMRVPAAAAVIAAAVLRDFLSCKVKIVYRDKSTDRPRRYMRDTFWASRGVTCVNGFCLKKDATHADLYVRFKWRSEVYFKRADVLSQLHSVRAQLSTLA